MFAAETSDIVVIVGAIAGVATALISAATAVALAVLAFKTAKLKEETTKLQETFKKETKEIKEEAREIKASVEVVHKATNSLADKMGEAKLAQGISEGKATGLQQGRDESAAAVADKPLVLAGPVKVETVAIDANVVNVEKKEKP